MKATVWFAGHLLKMLDEPFDRRSWHGPNLRGALRGISANQAAWRPADGAHNIWELAMHAAYWKYVVLRKIAGGKPGGFVLKGSNYLPRPVELSEAAWKKDLAILEAIHQDLRQAVGHLKPGASTRLLHMIRGVAAHDLYHAGQIRLIRRLHTGSGR
jgi:hypothetical protein